MSEEIAKATVVIRADTTGFKEDVDATVEDATQRPRDARGRFVKIGADTTGFTEDVDAKVKEATARPATIKVKADTTEANAKIDETKAKANSLGDSAGGFGSGIGLMGASIALALPLLPELAAGLAAISGAVFAAGAGLGSFGAVVLTDITNATQATQKLQAAQTAVDNATSNSARADALIKQKALIDSLGPSTIALGQAITSLEGIWKSFAAGFTPEITRDVTQFAGILATSLPLVQPVITAGAGAVSTILTNLDTALQSPAAKQFMAWLAGTAEQDILGLTKAFGGFGGGVLELFKAFAPLETLVVNGLAGTGTAFEKWSANLSGTQGFQQFLKYAAENGPLLTKTLSDVAEAVGKILASVMPLLPPLLHLVDYIANLINDKPGALDFIDGVAAAFLAWKIISTVTGWVQGLGGALDILVTKLTVVRAAEELTGASVNVAPVVASIGEIGIAADAAKLSVGGLLSLLGVSTLAAVLAAGGIYAMLYAQGKAGDTNLNTDIATGNGGQPLPGVRPGSAQSITDLYLAAGGSTVGTNVDNTEMEHFIQQAGTPAQKAALANLLQAMSYPSGVPLPPFYLAKPGQPSQKMPIDINDPIYRSTAADLQDTYNSQVPGGATSYFGNTGASGDGGGKGSGLPPGYSLPNSATGAGNAAALAAVNNAQGLAALLGLNIMQALAQGITTGINPLTDVFTNINLKLTGPAQTLATAFESLVNSALSYGQAAAKSLAFSVTAAPTVGTQTLISPGPNGLPVTTVQSQLVGSSFNALFTDQKFVADIGKAKALGLSTELLGQFVQAGPSSVDVLDALVSSGAGAISQLNQNNAAIDALGNTYGIQTASDKYLPQIHADLQQLLALSKTAPAAHAAAVGPATGRAVGAVINKGAAAGARTARLTAPKGAASSSGRRFN